MSLLESQSICSEENSRSLYREFVDSSGITAFVVFGDGEIKLSGDEWQKNTLQNNVDSLRFPKPVYVENDDNTERLIYNRSKMELGKLYQVNWNGQDYALRKTMDEVEILKFYPDQ